MHEISQKRIRIPRHNHLSSTRSKFQSTRRTSNIAQIEDDDVGFEKLVFGDFVESMTAAEGLEEMAEALGDLFGDDSVYGGGEFGSRGVGWSFWVAGLGRRWSVIAIVVVIIVIIIIGGEGDHGIAADVCQELVGQIEERGRHVGHGESVGSSALGRICRWRLIEAFVLVLWARRSLEFACCRGQGGRGERRATYCKVVCKKCSGNWRV